MKRFAAMILILSLLLSGCSTLFDGNYHSVKPHEEQSSPAGNQAMAVSSYASLYRTLGNMVASGTANFILSMEHYDQLAITRDMRTAIQEIITNHPYGAYAVKDITFEVGTNAGQPAVAVTVDYLRGQAELRKIKTARHPAEVRNAISAALDNCDPGLVLYVDNYEQLDFVQWVEDYITQNPNKVMEQPQVTTNLYPEEGYSRIVEIKFLYQNSREYLRGMQTQVQALFTEAVQSLGDTEDPAERYEKLYLYLTTRFDTYQQKTSTTPAYSLLLHGVGDAKAFASVYYAMCRSANLECILVTGTRADKPWCWNIVRCGEVYYHVDLLQCMESGAFQMATDPDMSGYYWDYSLYPPCGTTQ